MLAIYRNLPARNIFKHIQIRKNQNSTLKEKSVLQDSQEKERKLYVAVYGAILIYMGISIFLSYQSEINEETIQERKREHKAISDEKRK